MLQVEYGIELTSTLQLRSICHDQYCFTSIQHLYYQHKDWMVQLV